MADTSVALATANVQVVSSKFLNRLLMVSYHLSPHDNIRMLIAQRLTHFDRLLKAFFYSNSESIRNDLLSLVREQTTTDRAIQN